VTTRQRVDVREGREGLELRVDGTLASLQRPGQSLTGTVWWALACPIVLVPTRRSRRRVLILGLAAGSVAAALRELAPELDIVGIERDHQVLEAARHRFGLDHLDVELHAVDARDHLARETRRFDLIVEDLFVGPSRSVRKPDWLLGEGYPAIGRRLRRGGFVSANTIHEMPGVVRALRPITERIVSLDVRDHWNRIVVCGRDLPPARELRHRLSGHRPLSRPLRALALRAR